MKEKKTNEELTEELISQNEENAQNPEEKTEQTKTESETKDESKEESVLKQRLERDIAELKSLFPDISINDIPDEVWQRVEQGESLAASYALFFIKRIKENERIKKVNEKNIKKAVPRVSSNGSGEVYFSPEAVRSMSAAEVRKNYDAILKSMDSWKN